MVRFQGMRLSDGRPMPEPRIVGQKKYVGMCVFTYRHTVCVFFPSYIQRNQKWSHTLTRMVGL